MLMQVLDAGGMPVASDGKRKPDRSNPKGYLEVESIIDKLKDDPNYVFNFEDRVLKVIAYGLQYLPPGSYKLIYVERNIEEILDSMEEMMRARDEERDETRKAFIKLDNKTKADIREREDMQVLFVNYNEILSSPKKNLEEIHGFLGERKLDLEKMIEAVDEKLYRQRRER